MFGRNKPIDKSIYLFIFRVYILKFTVIMFHYMQIYGERLKRKWTNTPSCEESIARQMMLERIQPKFLTLMTRSFNQAKLRKQYYQPWENMQRECKEMATQLHELYQSITSATEFDIIALATAFYNIDGWIPIIHDFLNKRTRIMNSPNERCTWSSAVIVMSIHLLNNLRFTETRNCLAAVEYMIMLMERDNQSLDTIPNTVTELKARVADAWLTYTSQILWASSSNQETNPLNQ
ncbi:hypothetical protein DMN91_005484 [Ooceraea biroi]|uniref:Uncharacterized protein n=1 Tax=Ooceraea biroi TaxID=2015173 RepID=A0A3L8DL62_OOCBI|nr:uncharacterized protein LOC105280813 [Ooceraea biroi]RLU21111.1 hypothetical protein DMN91_005484 [Ooceraea biroi]